MAVGVKAAAFAGFAAAVRHGGRRATGPTGAHLIILAILTMVVGNLLALPQRNLKRMLAYSSIAHAGYLLLGVIAVGRAGDSSASAPILFYLAAYAFMNLGAFGVLVLDPQPPRVRLLARRARRPGPARCRWPALP